MPEEKNFDYILVGQGLAGSLLTYFLLEKGQSVFIFDEDHKGSSSNIAAGVINPITGYRFVKSWMFDELRDFNELFYRKIELEFGINLYSERNILRFLRNNGDANEWFTRSTFEGNRQYMKPKADLGHLQDKIVQPVAIGEIEHAAQVNMPLLIQTLKNRFTDQAILQSVVVDYGQVEFNFGRIAYNGFTAKKVIFCEGQRGRFNPFFSYLPFEVSKGEILIVRAPDLKSEKILKDKIMIAPLGNDLYWCGSNYEWNSRDDLPTDAFRTDFEKKLRHMLKVDFEVVEHLAAIRPTVKDRRPFIGLHPKYKELAIFNGLGTKGASLGPYWADRFSDFLIKGTGLDPEVNIERFELKNIVSES